MKTPTTTIVVHDWAAVYKRIETGEVLYLEDMTQPMTRTLNMWMRVHVGYGVKCRVLLAGGFQVAIGNPVPVTKRKYLKGAKA